MIRHAVRLPEQRAAPRLMDQRRGHPPGPGPVGQMADGVPQLGKGKADLGEIGLLPALAQVGVEGSGDLLLPLPDGPVQDAQLPKAEGQRQRGAGGVVLLLQDKG